MARFGRPRCIPLSASAAALIAPWAAKAKPGESDLIFPSPAPRAEEGAKPTAVEKREYGKAIERAAKKAGVEAFGPNRIRHLVGTLVRSLSSLDDARCVLGHQDQTTTLIYAERDEASARAAVEKLEAFLSASGSAGEKQGPPPPPEALGGEGVGEGGAAEGSDPSG